MAKTTPKLVPVADPVSDPETTSAPALRLPMKVKDLVDRAAERSGVKRSDAKSAIEAALALIGDAVAEGQDLQLDPLGKIKVKSEKATERGKVFMLRVVRNVARPAAKSD